MRISYACINKSINSSFKTMTVKRASQLLPSDRFNQIQSRTRKNFETLLDIMKWNASNNIKMYRVSSDLVVLATHEINDYNYKKDKYIMDLCDEIRKLAEKFDIRLTIHPSQFNVLSSEKESVIQNTITQLSHEADLCDLLGVDTMCIHAGSKKLNLFKDGFDKLPDRVKSYIAIENTERDDLLDILDIAESCKIPFILDFHHARVYYHKNNYSTLDEDISELLYDIINTWDRTPIAHLSSGRNSEHDNAHADYIKPKDWKWFLDISQGLIDVELESKSKDLALLELRKEVA